MTRYLLRVSFCVRQLGGHVEHNLLIMETCVNRFCPRLPVSDIQASPKPGGENKKRKQRLRPEQEEQREQNCAANRGNADQQLCGRQKSRIRSGRMLRAAARSALIHLLGTDKGVLSARSITLSVQPQISGHSKVLLFLFS